ncbi:MAG: YbhB/YbcL family Raf kinase inhibitor-like protein [Candidatus Nanoarchaeia archaeon]|nr:YbhB/YbcL family Raf kinase inhibitor-like protein [Candidatus Nanoarchaeia archaeon]
MEFVQKGSLKLTSPAFRENGIIPKKYTCDGEKINPELIIEVIPVNTKTLALIMDDPDAPSGDFVHWVMWNITPVSKIEENSVPAGAVVGINSGRKNNYFPPCPPSGVHRYIFKLYALNTELNLASSSNKQNLLEAMNGHILSQTSLVGKYSRD